MKTLTAIGNSEVDYSIFEKNGYKLLARDIIYQDGIFELLDIYRDIEVLFISDVLMGEFRIEILIKKILKKYDKIDIIVFLENYNYEQINIINSCGVYKIYELNNYKDFFLNKENQGITSFKKELKNRIQSKQNKNRTCIIAILGIGGVGKSIVACLIAKSMVNNGNKVLLMTNQESTQEFILEYKNNRKPIFSGFEVCLLLESKFKDINYEIEYFYNELKKIQNRYDYVIIDMNQIASQKEKILYEFSNKIIVLLEANKLSMYKTQMYLNEKNNIFKNKTEIIINKKNNFSFDIEEIRDYFYENKIIGEIKYYEKIDEIINQNIFDNKIFDDIGVIVKKIE